MYMEKQTLMNLFKMICFNRILLLLSVIYPLLLEAKGTVNNYFVTPEDFGCISNKIEAAHNNSIGLQKAIDYACSKGVKLVSAANKKYYLEEGIVIKAPVDINFNMGTLVATDTVDIITINDGKGKQWAGVVAGLKIDLNKKGRIGINCLNAVKLHITDCAIIGVPKYGAGIRVDKGYEVFVDNVHFEGGDDLSTGIQINTHDCHFTDCVMIDCHTAVDCRGSNFFERIHAWMGPQWLSKSTCFKIRGGGPIFLHQCFSDTFDWAFDIETATELHISQHKNFHNRIMWTKDVEHIQPEFFHFRNREDANRSKIFLDNSYIGGLVLENLQKQVFSNIMDNSIIISNSVIP